MARGVSLCHTQRLCYSRPHATRTQRAQRAQRPARYAPLARAWTAVARNPRRSGEAPGSGRIYMVYNCRTF